MKRAVSVGAIVILMASTASSAPVQSMKWPHGTGKGCEAPYLCCLNNIVPQAQPICLFAAQCKKEHMQLVDDPNCRDDGNATQKANFTQQSQPTAESQLEREQFQRQDSELQQNVSLPVPENDRKTGCVPDGTCIPDSRDCCSKHCVARCGPGGGMYGICGPAPTNLYKCTNSTGQPTCVQGVGGIYGKETCLQVCK